MGCGGSKDDVAAANTVTRRRPSTKNPETPPEAAGSNSASVKPNAASNAPAAHEKITSEKAPNGASSEIKPDNDTETAEAVTLAEGGKMAPLTDAPEADAVTRAEGEKMAPLFDAPVTEAVVVPQAGDKASKDDKNGGIIATAVEEEDSIGATVAYYSPHRGTSTESVMLDQGEKGSREEKEELTDNISGEKGTDTAEIVPVEKGGEEGEASNEAQST